MIDIEQFFSMLQNDFDKRTIVIPCAFQTKVKERKQKLVT